MLISTSLHRTQDLWALVPNVKGREPSALCRNQFSVQPTQHGSGKYYTNPEEALGQIVKQPSTASASSPALTTPPFFRFKINFHLLPTWCLKALRWKKKKRRKNIFHLGWGYTQRAYQKWPCTPSDSFAEGFWASMLFLLILKEKDKEVVILGRDSKAKGVVHRGWKSQVIFQQWKSFSAPILLEKGWIHMSVFHFTDYEWLLCSQHYEPEWGLCEKAPLPCAHGYSTHIGQPTARTTKSPSLS